MNTGRDVDQTRNLYTVCVKDRRRKGGGGEGINIAISLGEDQGNHFALKSVAENPMRQFVRTYRVSEPFSYLSSKVYKLI